MSKSQHIEDENPIRVPNPDKPGPIGRTPVEKVPEQDKKVEATVEEFGEEGMGVGSKE